MQFIPMNDGAKIAVYDPNPKGRRTIFMVHGWPLTHKIFEYNQEFLIRQGFRVVTMDLRGFGQSDATAIGYTYDELAADLHHVIRTLGLRSFILAGFSMGGAIALRYMARYRGFGVQKLVLIAAAAPCFTRRPDFPFGMPKEAVDSLIQQAQTDRPQMALDFGKMLFAVNHTAALRNWFYDISLDTSGIATIQTAYSLRDEDGRADLAQVHVPTGIFHGKKDAVVPYDLAIIQQKGIKRSVLYPFEESGHGVFYDALDSFNERLLSFINDRP